MLPLQVQTQEEPIQERLAVGTYGSVLLLQVRTQEESIQRLARGSLLDTTSGSDSGGTNPETR